LSLTVAGSLIKASLGAVSGVVVEVTQSGAAPAAFAATQPAGSAGATTPSKFSLKTMPVHGVGVGVGDSVGVGVGDGVGVGVGVPLGIGVGIQLSVAMVSAHPPAKLPVSIPASSTT